MEIPSTTVAILAAIMCPVVKLIADALRAIWPIFAGRLMQVSVLVLSALAAWLIQLPTFDQKLFWELFVAIVLGATTFDRVATKMALSGANKGI